MKRKFKKWGVSLIMATMLVLSLFLGESIQKQEVRAAGTWPAMSAGKYMKCFTISTGNNTIAYTSPSLRSKKGVIYASDELYVYKINDTYAYCSYPIRGGRKYAYIPTSAICVNNQVHTQTISRAKITTTKRAGSGNYGYIAKGDWVMRVATSGKYSQVIYPASNTMKMGWISTASYNSDVAAVSPGDTGSTTSTNYGINTAAGKLSTYGKIR